MIDGAKLKRDILNDIRVDLANTQYINGATNYLDLLDAQRSYLNSQMQYSTAVVQEYKALVSLYKALGGATAAMALKSCILLCMLTLPFVCHFEKFS